MIHSATTLLAAARFIHHPIFWLLALALLGVLFLAAVGVVAFVLLRYGKK